MTTTAGRWTKLYGSLVDGDALAMSRDARLLGVEAEAWSDDAETDGRIPRNALRRITDATDPEALAAELVAAGRWEPTDEGWTIVGFLDRHDDAETRAAGRDANTSRLRGWRDHRDGRHSPDGPKSCDACNGVRNTVRNGVRNTTRSEAKRQRSEALDRDGSARSGLRPSRAPRAGTVGDDDVPYYLVMHEQGQVGIRALRAGGVSATDPRITKHLNDYYPHDKCFVCGDEWEGGEGDAVVKGPPGDAESEWAANVHEECATHPSVVSYETPT